MHHGNSCASGSLVVCPKKIAAQPPTEQQNERMSASRPEGYALRCEGRANKKGVFLGEETDENTVFAGQLAEYLTFTQPRDWNKLM